MACGDDVASDGSDVPIGDAGSSLPEAGVLPRDGATTTTIVRIANLSLDLGAVDFCYRTAKSSSFEGPVVGKGIGGPKRDAGADADAGDAANDADDDASADAAIADGGSDAGVPAVAPLTMTRYLGLDTSGALTIALVAPGATSCATPIFSADVTLDPGRLSTVAILGRSRAEAGADDALGLAAYVDDGSTVPAKARVRMIHAALGEGGRSASPALAARAVGAQTTTVASRIEPRKIASPSTTIPVDALGYATIAPVPGPNQLAVGGAEAMGSDAAVAGWVSDPTNLGLTGSSLHTGFVLTGSITPFEVLWCTDTSTKGDLTICSLLR